MRWIHLISVIALAGTVFSIRHLVMPALQALEPEDAAVYMGKFMNRARRVLRIALTVLAASEIYLFAARSANEPISWRLLIKLVLTFGVTLIILLLSISPHRRLSLRVEAGRPQLLDGALGLLIALTAVSHFE